MNRTTFIVDGFNLYHSVCQASQALGLAGSGVKWLDLHGLCRSYLSLIGGGAQLERVYYFSALATHLEPAKPNLTIRHRAYLECLEIQELSSNSAASRSKMSPAGAAAMCFSARRRRRRTSR